MGAWRCVYSKHRIGLESVEAIHRRFLSPALGQAFAGLHGRIHVPIQQPREPLPVQGHTAQADLGRGIDLLAIDRGRDSLRPPSWSSINELWLCRNEGPI